MLPTLWILISLATTVSGQCSGTAQTLTATSTPQYLMSPGWPSSYDNNLNCAWLILTSGSAIVINIQELSMESGSPCNDSLIAYSGSSDAGTLLYTFCTGNIATRVFKSTDVTGNIYLKFTTDFSITDTGFQLMYFISNNAYQPACGSNLTANTSETYLMTDTLPNTYTANLDCSYVITGPAEYTINITYYLIDFEYDASCANDIFVVRDGTDGSGTLLQVHCTSGNIYNVSSTLTTTNSAYIQFQTNANTNHYGFFVSYRAYLTTTNCSSTAISLSATEHHNYITTVDFGNSRYSNNLNCLWQLTAPSGNAVEVLFLLLNSESYSLEYNWYCSYDYIIFYDGTNTSADVISRFCGSTMVTHTYRSSSTEMLIRFRADYALVKNGFRLAYKYVDNTYPDCKSSYTTIIEPLYNVENTYINNSYTYINITTSSNYPSYYSSYTDEFWLLSNTNDTFYSAIIEFTAISIERSRGCIYDKLVIYDGACIKDGPLHTICGRRLVTLELTKAEHLIHFHTDNSYNLRGFSFNYYANYTYVTLPPTTTTTTNGPPVEAVVNVINTALENYTAENLPNRDLTDAIVAKFDFYLVGINGLDEVEQTLTTTGQFVVTWNDSSMAWIPSKQQGVVRMLIPQDDLWKPDIVLLNGVTAVTPMGASFMFVDIDFNGVCLWRPYQILESTCKVDMTFYPYDTQTCIIKISTWSSSGSQVSTTLGDLGLQLDPGFQENAVWKLLSKETVQDMENGQNVVKFKLTIQRSPAYVTFYITIPIIMLAYLNVFTFVIPCDSGEKSGFSITVFLSFIVVLIVITDSMPDNSDSISLFGAYVFTMTVLSALATMISVLQIRVISLNEEERHIPNKLKTCLAFFDKRKWKIFKQRTPMVTLEKEKEADDSDSDQSEEIEIHDEFAVGSKANDTEHVVDAIVNIPRKSVSFKENPVSSIDGESGSDIGSTDIELQRELTTTAILIHKEDTFFENTKLSREYGGDISVESNGIVNRAYSDEIGDSVIQSENNEDSMNVSPDTNNSETSSSHFNSKRVKFTDEFEFDGDGNTVDSGIDTRDSATRESENTIQSNDSENKSSENRCISSQPPTYESLAFDADPIDTPTTAGVGAAKRISDRIMKSDSRPVSRYSQRSVNTDRPLSRFSFVDITMAKEQAPQKPDVHSDEESLVGSYSSESDSDDLNEDNEDDGPSWVALVNVSDIILFAVYLVITTIFTIGIFVPLALN